MLGDFKGKVLKEEGFTAGSYVDELKLTTKPRIYLLSKRLVQVRFGTYTFILLKLILHVVSNFLQKLQKINVKSKWA